MLVFGTEQCCALDLQHKGRFRAKLPTGAPSTSSMVSSAVQVVLRARPPQGPSQLNFFPDAKVRYEYGDKSLADVMAQ